MKVQDNSFIESETLNNSSKSFERDTSAKGPKITMGVFNNSKGANVINEE